MLYAKSHMHVVLSFVCGCLRRVHVSRSCVCVCWWVGVRWLGLGKCWSTRSLRCTTTKYQRRPRDSACKLAH